MTRAFLVIDIQNEYFAGGAVPLWQPDETEARIVSAIGSARTAGDKVILVRHVSAATTGLFAAGSSNVEIRPAVLSAAGDTAIVTKRYADAFQDTDLTEHLVGIDDLLVCGMMTQNCVVFTAMSRAADAFKIQVVGDLCTAPTETVHRIALNALGSKTQVSTAAKVWT